MVNPLGAIIPIVLGAIVIAAVFFRKELLEAGIFLGRGASALGTGVGTGIGEAFSFKIRPEIVPKVGLGLEFNLLGNLFGAASTDTSSGQRTGGSIAVKEPITETTGRTTNVGILGQSGQIVRPVGGILGTGFGSFGGSRELL